MIFEIFESFGSDPHRQFTVEEVVDTLGEYDGIMDAIKNAATGLSQIPGTAFFLTTVNEQQQAMSLKSSVILALQSLSPETIMQDAPELTDTQVAHAVRLAFSELDELRSMVENIRKQAEDSPRIAFYRDKMTQIVSGKEVSA